MQQRVSVVVPSYNQAAYLPETLDSLLDQTPTAPEIIVVDGVSTDGSQDVLERYRPRIEAIGGRILIEPDDGQSHAINKGLRLATGDVVGWLCSDDTWRPGTLAAVVESFAADPKLDWLAGAVVMTDAAGEPIETIAPQGDFTLPGVLVRRADTGFELPQPGVFWRRSLHDELGYLREDMHHCFDFEWWLRLIASGRQPQRIDTPLATYRLHEQSKTCASSTKFLREHLLVEPEYARHLPMPDRWRALRRLSYYRRFTALAELRQANGSPWPLVFRKPWWLASQQVREALRESGQRRRAA
jgi:glycosyltransferase involved in cell wall biosynthesis